MRSVAHCGTRGCLLHVCYHADSLRVSPHTGSSILHFEERRQIDENNPNVNHA